MGHYVRMLIYSMYVPKETGADHHGWKIKAKDSMVLHWLSDCRSYCDSMGNPGQSIVADKRLAIDMTALRQDLWRLPGQELGEPSVQDSIPENCTDRLWWICTKDMVSDGLTKSMVWNDVVHLVSTGLFTLREPASRALTCTKGQKT